MAGNITPRTDTFAATSQVRDACPTCDGTRGTNPWTAFDAATQLYRDGVIDADAYDAAVLDAFGHDVGTIVLGAVFAVLGD